MKNKDQKRLEILYEQVVEGEEFSLLKEEEEYFTLVAKDITKEVYEFLEESNYNYFPHQTKLKTFTLNIPFCKRDFIKKKLS